MHVPTVIQKSSRLDCEICRLLTAAQVGVLLEDSGWRVTLAPDQLYLGRVYVTPLRHIPSLAEVSVPEHMAFRSIVILYESAVKRLFDAQLVNWAALMNNAFREKPYLPHLHWHARPRYNHPVEFAGKTFEDQRFGRPIIHGPSRPVSPEFLEELAQALRPLMRG